MKRIIASLLLLWGAQVIPAAPAPSPASYAQAAKLAADQDNLQELFTQLRKISDKDPRKAEVLNHFFSKPQVMLGDAYKNQLIAELHGMYNARFIPGVATVAGQINIGGWADYLAEQNPKLAEFFDWIRVEKEKQAAVVRMAAEETGKKAAEKRTDTIVKVMALVHTDANKHPYTIVAGVKEILSDDPHLFAKLGVRAGLRYMDTERFSFGLSSLEASVILSLLQCARPSKYPPLCYLNEAENNLVRRITETQKGNFNEYYPLVVKKYEKQLADMGSMVNSAINHQIPAPLIALIAGYATPYPWGRSIGTVEPVKNDTRCERRWYFDGRMIDSLDGFLSHADAASVTRIGLESHLLTELSADLWKHLPNLLDLDLCNGLLTDYPAEIEQIPTLRTFDLTGNPLTPEAKKRYGVFQTVLFERRQKDDAERIAKAKEMAVAAGNPDDWQSWFN